ncbi:MAG TPA: hypothetical protein VML75_17855 [Kofleriaceae bacterium]|nr:hypothetical protein [Kofleriaceae bacterium]
MDRIGPFGVERVLARGDMSVVYEGTHTATGARVRHTPTARLGGAGVGSNPAPGAVFGPATAADRDAPLPGRLLFYQKK